MILSLRQLELGKVHFNQRFSVAELTLDDALGETGLTIPDGVGAAGEAELASELTGEIRLRGDIEANGVAVCDRCLEPITVPLSGPFRVSYEPRENEPIEDEVEISEKDAEVSYYEGDGLNLADVVREQVLLALPMQKLCRPECQGICPNCGINRNESSCDCHVEQVDERWAALKSLKQ
jgi:uncharacterized protein